MTDLGHARTFSNSSLLASGKPPSGGKNGPRVLPQHPVTGVTLPIPLHSVGELSWSEQAKQAAAAVVSEVADPKIPLSSSESLSALL